MKKRLFSMLLACMMACAPAAQVLAETAFEASAGVSGQILFPGDSLVNPVGAVLVDGAEAVLDETGAWENTDENKVYTATSAEDGTIQVTQAGYVLIVEEGTASRKEGEDIDNHYEFLDWEKPTETDPVKDIACYQSGETIRLIANAPKEGMAFSHWSTETEGVVIADPYNMETTIVMPEKKAEIRANYVEAALQTEASAEPIDVPAEPIDVPAEQTEASVTVPEIVYYDVTVNYGDGSGSYAAGDWVSLAAYDRSAENMEFTGWYVDSMNATLDDAGSMFAGFTMPEASVIVSATYTEITQAPTAYEVVVNDGTGSGTYEPGTAVTVTAQDRSAEGYEFAGWFAESMNVVLEDTAAMTTSFVMPQENVKIAATYIATVDDIITDELNLTEPESGSEDDEPEVIEDEFGEGAPGEDETDIITDESEIIVDEPGVDAEAENEIVMSETDISDTEAADEVETEAVITTNMLTFSNEAQGADDMAMEISLAGQTDFPADSRGSVEMLKDGALNDAVASLEAYLGDKKVEPKLSLSIEVQDSEGREYTDLGSVDVKIYMTNAQAYAGLGLYHQKNDGTWEELSYQTFEATEAEPSFIVFNTTSFSPFLFAETEQSNTESEDGTSETESTTQMYTVAVDAGERTVFGGGEYAANTQVTIEVDAAEDEQVIDWLTEGTEIAFETSGNTMWFTMPAGDVKVTPVIEKTYQLTLKNNASLSDNVTTEATYAAGDVVSVVAKLQNSEGKNFTGWVAYESDGKTKVDIEFKQGDTLNSATFVMPEKDIIVKGVYRASYIVTVSNGLINDSVTQMSVTEGTEITVTANKGPEGKYFAGWVINDGTFDMGEATYEQQIWLKVTQDLTILATYEGYQYDVVVNNGTSDYDYSTAGTVVTVTADAAPEGMQFDSWYVDSQNVALADAGKMTTNFVMPESAVTLTARYKQLEFQVSMESGNTAQQYYHSGEVVTISANYPASGRVFDKWVAVSGNVTFADATRWQTTFTMPASEVVIKATYKDGPYAGNNLIQEIIAGGEYLTESTIRFTAVGAGMDNTNPNPGDYRYRPSGYQIGNVTGTWQSAPYSTSMSIKAAGEYTLKVIYNKDVYDGTKWVSEGTSDSKSVTFYVVTEAAGVDTGDDTPLAVVIAVAGVSCVLFIILLVVFLRRRRK